jgi:hypothetical protein
MNKLKLGNVITYHNWDEKVTAGLFNTLLIVIF